jgi:translation initiation factor 3 subunit M
MYNLFSLLRLWLLFQSMDETSSMRYHVYCHVIQAAKTPEQIRSVFQDVDHLKSIFAASPPNNDQIQKLLRLLHDVLLTCNQRLVLK